MSFLGLPNDWWSYIANSAWLNVVIWVVIFDAIGAVCVALDVFTVHSSSSTVIGGCCVLNFVAEVAKTLFCPWRA